MTFLSHLRSFRGSSANLGATIHLLVSHKIDHKAKILVCYANDPLIEYELLREVKLDTQLDVLCQLAKAIGQSSSYMLQLKDSERVLTQEVSEAKRS